MTDITYTGVATLRRNDTATFGKGDAANTKALDATISIPATTAAGSTFKLIRVPSNARIFGLSEVAWDDVDDTNSVTLDFGFASVDSNITSDPDALSNGHDATSAGTAKLIAGHADYGKKAYEFVSGQTTDPKGELDLYVTVADFATTKIGSASVSLMYTLD